jgi:heme exporter protein B
LSTFRTHLQKDLRLEWRSRDALNAILFFSLLVVVIFSFAFDPTAEESRLIAGGIIWVAFLFASVVALNQSWMRELRNQVLDAVRLTPAPAEHLFLAKACSNYLFVLATEVLIAPVFVIFYNLHVLGRPVLLVPTLLLGTWALVVNGTFFAALSLHVRSREVMLPLILFPISIPAVLSMVEATTAIFTGTASPTMWLNILGGYDVIFTMVGILLFEPVLNAE